MAKAAPQRPNSLVGLSSQFGTDSFDSPQPPPSTPTRAQTPANSALLVTPRAVRTSLAKSPDASTANKLAGTPRILQSPKSPKELRLPRLASFGVSRAGAARPGLQETLTLPKFN